MEIFGISIKGIVKPNIRVLLLPLLLISFLLIISLVVFKNGVAKISSQLKQLKDARKIESTLQEKINLLQQMGGAVLSQSDLTVIALPENNPALIMLIQLNSLADKYALAITEKQVSMPLEAQGGLSKATITFKTGGELLQLTDFIKGMRSLAPLSTLDEVSISKEAGVLTAEAKISVYFGKFPEELPPLTQPIKALTDGEELIFEKILGLTKPEFIELSPTEPGIREDPFN